MTRSAGRRPAALHPGRPRGPRFQGDARGSVTECRHLDWLWKGNLYDLLWLTNGLYPKGSFVPSKIIFAGSGRRPLSSKPGEYEASRRLTIS